MGCLPGIGDCSLLRLFGVRPPIGKRCRYCRPGRLARLGACGIADRQARTWNGSRNTAVVGPVGSHARRRSSDTGNYGCGREARTHAKRDPRDLPNGHHRSVNVHARSTWSQCRFGHASGYVLSWISFASCFLAIGLSLEALGIPPAIGLGVLAAVATSVLVLWTDRQVSASPC